MPQTDFRLNSHSIKAILGFNDQIFINDLELPAHLAS